jgi:hypothetical protein
MSSSEHSPPPGRREPSPSAPASRVARLAAVGALIVSVVFPLIVLSFVADDPTGLVLAFVWVFVIAFCGWFFVTRRGYRRLLVLPALLWALINLFGFAYDHKVVLPTLIGVLALFGLAARYAVRHVRTRAHGTGRYARAAEPGRKCVLIINPKSGGGKAELFNLPEEARKRGIHPLVLGPGDNLFELADRAVTQGADVIGMAGGDGSQALVASVAMQHDVAHVCVPAGTRNHFALDLGLDRDDVVGALDAFTDGVERRIDLASLNERIFVNNASLGIYARVVQSDAYRDGKLGTWKRMLPEMLGRDAAASALLFDYSARDGLGERVTRDRLEQSLSAPPVSRGGHTATSGHGPSWHLRDSHARGRRGRKAGDSRDDRPASPSRWRAPVVFPRVRSPCELAGRRRSGR